MSSDEARVWLLPGHLPFADAVVETLWSACAAQAPDLSQLTLVTPTPGLSQALQGAFLRRAGGALLAPASHTLRTLAPTVGAMRSPLACRIRIAEAVTRFRKLFPAQAPLLVADSLYALFDELTRQQLAPEADEAALLARLQRGYGLPRPLAALSREAAIVHRLYAAFIEDVGAAAPAAASAIALAETLAAWPSDRPLIFAGFDALTPAEAMPISAALGRGAWFFAQGTSSGRADRSVQRLFAALGIVPAQAASEATPRSALLHACLADDAPAGARAAALRGASPDGLVLAAARDAEHEAQMADLAVRKALLGGARRLAVIANDRRLARRLRARLERAGIALVDRGGWALSTSRVAAALNDWLTCAERDFPYRALLDLAKSGLLPQGADWASTAEPLAYRHGIEGGWNHWRRHAQGAAQIDWLDGLAHAAEALNTLRGPRPAAAHAKALDESLQRLGLKPALAADEAGARVLQVLADLATALADSSLQLSWAAFRALLDQALEETSFSLTATASPVQLLTLAEAQGLSADVVVLTGATAALLAAPQGAPFFNASVRRELGLVTAAEQQALALTRLQRLLLAAPQVTVLYAPAEAGEPALPAPVLVALTAFAEAAGCPLPQDAQLALEAPLAEIAVASAQPSLLRAPRVKAGTEIVHLLDEKGLSASGHQALVDCPYRFHARYALGLSLADDPDEPLGARDYGERVHELLQAFYEPVADYPPPYEGDFGEPQRAAIVAHLQRLADQSFAADLDDRAMGRAWRETFARQVPWIATQLIAAGTLAVRVEVEINAQHEGVQLRGSIDRLEDDGEQQRIIDYKTGATPSAMSIKQGEQVQLTHYALPRETSAIAYWNLKDEKVVEVADAPLEKLRNLVGARLHAMAAELRDGTTLPAHGSDAVCSRCDYAGLCRIPADERLAVLTRQAP